MGKLRSNKIKFERNQIEYIPHFKAYLDILPKLLTTPLGKWPPNNIMTENMSRVSFLIEIRGSKTFSVGIAYPFRTHRANCNKPNIQPTIIHCNQETVWGNSDWYYCPLGSLDSGTDVQIRGYGHNIDNRTGMNPQGPIGTIIPGTNSESKWNIFDSFSKNSDLA